MNNAHSGFLGSSNIQLHSCGKYFPTRIVVVSSKNHGKIQVVRYDKILKEFQFSKENFSEVNKKAERFAEKSVSYS